MQSAYALCRVAADRLANRSDQPSVRDTSRARIAIEVLMPARSGWGTPLRGLRASGGRRFGGGGFGAGAVDSWSDPADAVAAP